MISKAEGDDIDVQTPKGKRSYLVRRLLTIHQLIVVENGGNSE